MEKKGKERKMSAYLRGFGNVFRSEALPGALPDGQNNPQRCPYGLYAEQLSGTAFTKTPREHNLKSWLYRIKPSVQHEPMVASSVKNSLGRAKDEPDRVFKLDPNQLRWSPRNCPSEPTSFVTGITTMGQAGSPKTKHGLAVHLYSFNKSMEQECLTNADGDLLIVPQLGTLLIVTEFGELVVEPTEICVIQRGMRFCVKSDSPHNRGYMCELFEGHFSLPELGPIGANGLANAVDFESPVAKFHDDDQAVWKSYTKFGGQMFECNQGCPFNVVAYHGNYVPYKYDLKKFCCMNSVTYDHPDPSIYTVLTCQSADPGVAVCDFVIFPPRWMAMTHTFRPPYFHRNTMTEFMGMIWGEYDAKKGGFVPGGSSLHSCMTPHGPDAETFKTHSDPSKVDTNEPAFFDKGLAFMFESSLILELNPDALTCPERQLDYQACWSNMPKTFDASLQVESAPRNTTNLLHWRSESAKQQQQEEQGGSKRRKT